MVAGGQIMAGMKEEQDKSVVEEPEREEGRVEEQDEGQGDVQRLKTL